jgi:hypothetical protein
MALDYSTFDDEQLANAAKVAAAAEKYGINPDFVMPMVMAESGFRHIKNPKSDAFGIMQLMPATAKGLKVDPNDVDENIDGGMRLLKELASNPKIGNDPYKILAGYNAGPTTPFLLSGDLQDLPEETIQHMAKVSSFYGGELPSNPVTETVGENAVAIPSSPTMGDGKKILEKDVEPVLLNPLLGAAIGAKAGAATGTAAALVDAKFNAASGLQEAFDSLRGRSPPTASVPEVAPVGQGAGAGTPVGQGAGTPVVQGVGAGAPEKVPGHERWLEPRSAGPIPKAFSNEMVTMTGNANVPGSGEEILARNAAAVRKVKELGYNPLTMQKYGDILLTEPSRVRPKTPDVWTRPRATGPSPFVARRAAPVVSPLPVLPPAVATPTSPLPVAAANAATESTSPLWKYAKRLAGFPLKGALAGAGTGLSVVDVYNRIKQGDDTGALLAGLGGAAGLAGTFVGSAGVLPSAAVALPLYNMARDRIEYLKKHPEAYQLQSDPVNAAGDSY